MRSRLVGFAAGFTLGYAALRAYDAWTQARSPQAQVVRDPRAYGRARRALMLAGIARSTAMLGWTAFALAPAAIRGRRNPRARGLRVGMTALAIVASAILETPADYLEGHVLERRYGLSKQSAADWLRERVKSVGVALVAGPLLVELLAAVAARAPRRWPWLATALAGPLLVLANLVVPTFVMPLFNRFEPLKGDLEHKLRALAGRYGVGDAQILRVDMSRQTEKANAYVTGLLGTHRIVIGDTLLEHFDDDEIEFVVAHELGHYVHGDVWRSVALGTGASAVLLFGAGALSSHDGEQSLANVATLARFLFFADAIGLLLGPALAAVSRSREWAADRFAVSATHAPEAGVRAFGRLRERNLAEDEQPLWMEVLFSSHPSLLARIRALEASS
jgi:Zn-dependent protease with chaperone function